MNLKECFDLAFRVRPEWVNSRGPQTLRINSKHCLRILGEELDIQTIKPSTFTKLGQQVVEEGRKPATANRVMAVLHTALHEAHLEGELAAVPSYRRLKEPEALPDYYSPEELQTFIQACQQLKTDQLQTERILKFCYYTGCRKSEVLGIQWLATDSFGEEHKCINFDENTCTFLRTKNGSNHTLPLHPELIPMLKEMYEERIDDDKLFSLSRNQLNNRINELKKLTGLGGKRALHQIRHSTATHLASSNLEIRNIQALLNHRDISTTIRYAKLTDDAKLNAVNRLQLPTQSNTDNELRTTNETG